MITTIFVWWQFFLLKKWIKVRTKFFYLILNFWFWYYFKGRPPVKMVDLFMCEVVTFIPAIDSARDIFEAQFIMQLCFWRFKYTWTTVQMRHLLLRDDNWPRSPEISLRALSSQNLVLKERMSNLQVLLIISTDTKFFAYLIRQRYTSKRLGGDTKCAYYGADFTLWYIFTTKVFYFIGQMLNFYMVKLKASDIFNMVKILFNQYRQVRNSSISWEQRFSWEKWNH
jgi:hypothetical protein